MQVFFCKYNDPLYVKMEKLEIMIKLANERNIDQASSSVHAHSVEPVSSLFYSIRANERMLQCKHGGREARPALV